MAVQMRPPLANAKRGRVEHLPWSGKADNIGPLKLPSSDSKRVVDIGVMESPGRDTDVPAQTLEFATLNDESTAMAHWLAANLPDDIRKSSDADSVRAAAEAHFALISEEPAKRSKVKAKRRSPRKS